jgi:hypothetical protein
MSDRNDRAIIHSLETGRGRRIAALVAGIVAVALVGWVLARGFHGVRVHDDARALTPSAVPTQPNR